MERSGDFRRKPSRLEGSRTLFSERALHLPLFAAFVALLTLAALAALQGRDVAADWLGGRSAASSFPCDSQGDLRGTRASRSVLTSVIVAAAAPNSPPAAAPSSPSARAAASEGKKRPGAAAASSPTAASGEAGAAVGASTVRSDQPSAPSVLLRKQLTPSEAVSNAVNCLSKLVGERQFDVACLQQMFINATSVIVIGSATFLKLPSLLKVFSTGSVAGLSEGSLIPDVFSGFLFAIYNIQLGIPFSLWGEVLIFAIQKAVLLLLFWRYSRPETSLLTTSQRIVVAMGSLGALSTLVNISMTRSNLSLLGLSPIPFLLLARGPQLFRICRRKHTGNQEIGPLLKLVIGSTARVGTTIMEIDDVPSLITCTVAVVFHVMGVSQILIYRGSSPPTGTAEQKESKKKQ